MKTFLLSICTLLSVIAFSQKTPVIQWEKSLGGLNFDEAAAVQPTTDGGYILAGRGSSTDGDYIGLHGWEYDYWVVKLNSAGAIEWQKSLGGTGSDEASSIIQTTDGGYIVAGTSYSYDGDVTGRAGNPNNIGTVAWIAKLSSTGTIQWQKSYGTGNEGAKSIQQTIDGGYVFAGSTGAGYYNNYWVVKITATGDVTWQKSIGGSYYDYAKSIKQTNDGGYIVAGQTESTNLPGYHGTNSSAGDCYIVKLNSTGDIQWQKCLGGLDDDGANDIVQTSDGSFMLAGYSFSLVTGHKGAHTHSDAWVVKLNTSGNILWQKSLGGNLDDKANSLQEIAGGRGYIIAGSTNSNDKDVSGYHGGGGATYPGDAWIVKLSNNGSLLWQKCIGGSSFDNANAISQTPGGGIIVAGYTYSNDGDIVGKHGGSGVGDDYLVVKLQDVKISIATDTIGNKVCSYDPVTFTATIAGDVTSPAYQWKKNNANVGTNNPVYKDSLLNTGDLVYCILTYNGIKDSSNIIADTVVNVTLPSVTVSIPAGTTLCAGTAASFKATVGYGGNSYILQWKKNNTNVGTNSTTYIDSALNNGDSVWCAVTSYTACMANPVVTSNKIKLTVTPATTPTITIASTPNTYRFCAVSAIQLTFTASIKNGGGAPVYQWKKNNLNVGTNSKTYTDSMRNGDSIWCILTSNQKCITVAGVNSNKIKLTVTTPVTPAITIVPLPAGSICLGTPVRYKASVKNGGSAPHYQWKKNNANVGADSDTYVDSLLFNNDSVWCVFTSNAECAVSNPATSAKIKQVVTYNPPVKPSPVSGPASVTANQQTLGYSVNQVNDVSYVWTVPAGCTIVTGQGTNQIIVNWGSTSGSIIVRAKNACGQSDSSKLLVRVVSSFSSGAVNDNTGSEDALKAAGKEGVELYPNPAVNAAYISFTSPEAGKYFIQVTDAQGRVLQTKETNAVKGANKLTIDVSHYAQGMYFIRLAGSNKQQSFRLLIQR